MFIEVLFVTNLFIFLYNNILRLLNFAYPSPTPFEFIRVGALPEPYEIPLYLILSATTVLALFLIHKYIKKTGRTLHIPFLKYFVFFFLIFHFINNLGDYPMAYNIYPFNNPSSPLTYNIYLISFLLITIFLVVETLILEKTIERTKIRLRIFFIIILGLIAFATFEPRFPIVGHDYSFFLGPIWEVLHGKTLYTEVPSQYGFLSILIFTALYNLHLLNLAYLPVLVWFLYILEYGICFYLIYRVGKSLPLALIGLISLITINYLSIYHLPASIPQVGPLRWLPLILAVFALHRFKYVTSGKFIFIISLFSFWVLDSGISLLMAFSFSLILLLISKYINYKSFLRSLFILIISLLSIFIFINVVDLFFGYRIIDILAVFSKFRQYAGSGFGMLPIKSYSYFWLVPLIYFASIIYFFKQVNHRESESPDSELERVSSFQTLLLFTANLSLFASSYFVGRSHIHNLFHISIFPILNAFLLFGIILKKIDSAKIKLLIFSFLFLIFVVYPSFNRHEIMTKIVQEKLKYLAQGDIFKPEWPTILTKKYEREIDVINKSLPEKQILILSPDDTYLFYLTGKENFLNDNSQITILTKEDMDSSLQKVFRSCPNKIVADCTLFKKCTASNPYTIISSFSIQPLILKRIQDVCKITYYPEICTSQLCIAAVNKK